MNRHAVFDHEKLDVYQLELAFVAWVTTLLREVKQSAEGLHREVCEQLDRASLSTLLNTAEGNGKRQGRQRAKFFDDARGSSVECAACLDALVARTLTTAERVAEGKAMLLRIVSMLTRLVERFDDSFKAPPRASASSASSSSSSSSIGWHPTGGEDEEEDVGRGRREEA